ncbi:hypothetical protein KIPB_013745, partial [Kipferlia bialata]|eukprot:g13745.t1
MQSMFIQDKDKDVVDFTVPPPAAATGPPVQATILPPVQATILPPVQAWSAERAHVRPLAQSTPPRRPAKRRDPPSYVTVDESMSESMPSERALDESTHHSQFSALADEISRHPSVIAYDHARAHIPELEKQGFIVVPENPGPAPTATTSCFPASFPSITELRAAVPNMMREFGAHPDSFAKHKNEAGVFTIRCRCQERSKSVKGKCGFCIFYSTRAGSGDTLFYNSELSCLSHDIGCEYGELRGTYTATLMEHIEAIEPLLRAKADMPIRTLIDGAKRALAPLLVDRARIKWARTCVIGNTAGFNEQFCSLNARLKELERETNCDTDMDLDQFGFFSTASILTDAGKRLLPYFGDMLVMDGTHSSDNQNLLLAVGVDGEKSVFIAAAVLANTENSDAVNVLIDLMRPYLP